MFVIIVSGVLGLVVGSFANVAVHRWPAGGTVTEPAGSVCPSCGASIGWRDNLPVVSWLLLRGRCRHCGERISLRYPVIEVATALLWGATAAVYGLDWLLPALLVFGWALVVATAIDLEHRIIPNRLTFRLAPILLVLLVPPTLAGGEVADLVRAVVAGVGVPAAMLLISEIFRVVRGQVGMGMGDIKLAVSIGLVVGYLGGWELLVWFYASVISSVVIAVGLMLTGRAGLATRIPYGPYLALGSIVALLGGDPLADTLARWMLG